MVTLLRRDQTATVPCGTCDVASRCRVVTLLGVTYGTYRYLPHLGRLGHVVIFLQIGNVERVAQRAHPLSHVIKGALDDLQVARELHHRARVV